MASWAIDVDDTLYCFNSLARQVVSEVAGLTDNDELLRAAYAPWTEWRTPADLMPGNLWLEIIDRCHTEEMIWENIPFKGAYQTLWKIIDSGHDIVYITNRNESTYGATAAWIERYGFPHSTNYDFEGNPLRERATLVCTTGSKAPFISHCQFLIDDRPKTLIEFVYDYDWKNKHGSNALQRKGFGLHRDYNAALTDVPGVYLAPTWDLLEKHMEKKGLISPYSVGKGGRAATISA